MKIKTCFLQFNSKETPFNDSDYPVSIDSKYYNISDSNKLNINKNSSLVTHLNIALLSKHFEDLKNFLSLLKHFFDIIGISEHEINKNSMNVFYSAGIYFLF